jgi:hypothetical protein
VAWDPLSMEYHSDTILAQSINRAKEWTRSPRGGMKHHGQSGTHSDWNRSPDLGMASASAFD